MLLKQIKDWFKLNYDSTIFQQVSIGEIDNNLEKALCFYNSKREIAYINRCDVSTYSIKPLTILMRFGKKETDAETIINTLYNFFDKKISTIDNRKIRFSLAIENPINLGRDDKGIIEYSLEVDCYYEKEEKR
ncbi:MAG: hypothetical protein J6J11_01665 [Treponema sp.]|nr:hypothetical protein [Treponema sp.]